MVCFLKDKGINDDDDDDDNLSIRGVDTTHTDSSHVVRNVGKFN